ncbi:MAG: FG-GAP repeat protein, partial [Planctomycetes bacterium]|nr:FG-GAP repeat protein [Planctomycetota bacterium]
MPHLIMPLLVAAAASVLSTAAAYADLGDQLFKLLPDDGAAGARFGISVAINGTTAEGSGVDAVSKPPRPHGPSCHPTS